MRRRTLALLIAMATVLAPRVATAQPCCGPITPEGQALLRFLDNSGVDHLWLKGRQIDWQTGQLDPAAAESLEPNTHCSSFVAAMALRLDIYVLRPPEHSQLLLANAQLGWLWLHGASAGWRSLADYVAAQQAANRGELVLEVFENPTPRRAGHIAIIRPSTKTRAELDADGPQETQAGGRNAISTSTKSGFKYEAGAWVPGGTGSLRYYAHTVTWPAGN